MAPISVKEFYKRIVSFREKMGIKHADDQYRNLFRMFKLSYLNVNQNDPEFSSMVAIYYHDAVTEYVRRMGLMGYSI